MSASVCLAAILILALGASAVADFLSYAPRAAMVRHLGLKKGTETQLGVISVIVIALLLIGRGHGVVTTVVASFLVGYFLVALVLHRRVGDKTSYTIVCLALAGVSLALAVLA